MANTCIAGQSRNRNAVSHKHIVSQIMSTVQLAREILSRSSSSSKEVPTLLARLARTLRETNQAHILTSMVPRVPVVAWRDATSSSSSSSSRIIDRQCFVDEMLDSATLSSIQSPPPPPDGIGRAPLSIANATYGETPPDTIRTLLSALSSAEYHGMGTSDSSGSKSNESSRTFEGSFIDAGSGNGIATVCAASTERFYLCKGVEYNKGRHGKAVRLRNEYERVDGDHHQSQSRVEFICGDLKDEAFHGSSVIFANSVVWDFDLCSAVGRNVDTANMVGPSLVVSVSRRLPSPSFDLVDILTMPCNGGEDFTFYICQKSGLATDAENSTCRIASSNNGRDSFALSDSRHMRALRGESGLLEELIGISMATGNEIEGMTLLASMGASEPSARVLLNNGDVLPHLAEKLTRDTANSLASRASSSLALRAMSDFPVGRRRIAEDAGVVAALIGSLVVEGCQGGSGNEHPAIRATVLDVLGGILNDPVGGKIVGSHSDIDPLLANVRKDANAKGWLDVVESCNESQTMRRWYGGEFPISWEF